jgi:glutamate dehydrogenase (NAD(P)+)
MEKRYQQNMNNQLIHTIEETTGKSLTAVQRQMLDRGADELDLVYSGLEETMINSYDQIRSTLMENKKIGNMRTAAFVTALRKIATSYETLGIFP